MFSSSSSILLSITWPNHSSAPMTDPTPLSLDSAESDEVGRNLSDLFYDSSASFDFDPNDMEANLAKLANLSNLSKIYDEAFRHEEYVRTLLVTLAYSVIFFISLFGNLMVCHIIITNRKLHTFTNCFIANLSVSDLLMTLINVPFGVARLLLTNWPFGSFFCAFLPFIQATSVYVSTITMCTISIDRYCVVVHPLGPRITNVVPLGVVLAVIWLISFTLAIPFAIYNEVVEMKWIFRRTVRCRAIVPSEEYNKALTMLSFLTQYLVPLTIASVAYASIAFSMKKRSKLGAMTREQISRILKTNRQTITMLVLCLITFAASWLPLHIFCLYRDFFNPNIHQTKVWLTVHWLAMSSVVYNPWIYSARNKHFRNGMKNFFRYLVFKRQNSESTINGLENGASMTQLTRVPSNRPLRGSYLCHVNRNHSLTRSFCNRAQTCMRSSSSSLEESSLQNTITSVRNGKAQHSVVVAKCATGRTASDSIIAKQTPVIDCTNRSNSNSAKMPASDTLHSVFASSDRESKAAETIASRSTPLLTGKMNSLPRLDNNRSSAMNGTLRHNVSLLNDVGSSNGVEDFKKCTTVSTALFAVDPTADSNNNEESPV